MQTDIDTIKHTFVIILSIKDANLSQRCRCGLKEERLWWWRWGAHCSKATHRQIDEQRIWIFDYEEHRKCKSWECFMHVLLLAKDKKRTAFHFPKFSLLSLNTVLSQMRWNYSISHILMAQYWLAHEENLFVRADQVQKNKSMLCNWKRQD